MKTRNDHKQEEAPKAYLTSQAGYAKAQAYCAKGERSERAVRNKLYLWRVDKQYYDEIIEQLKEHNYLSESRYALAFARDKHRLSGWGRERIKRELSLNMVSSIEINRAIAEVFEEFDETEQLENLLLKKQRQLKSNDPRRKHFEQMMRYAIYRGYTFDQARPIIERLLDGDCED